MSAVKIMYFTRRLSLLDFIRKVCYWINRSTLQRLLLLLRRIRILFYFKRWIGNCGENIVIKGLPLKVNVHQRITISDHCIFEFGPEAELTIGKEAYLSYGVVLSCLKRITVGEYVQVGEYTSIRDTTHQYKEEHVPIKKQNDVSDEVIIGNDVWIGRGCMILPGSKIGNGVIIGANSVVKGELEDYGIYAGAPAKLVKRRKNTQHQIITKDQNTVL